MDYRVLTENEIQLAQALVDDCGYYAPVQLSEIGGLVLGCLHGEKLVAAVWLSLTGRRAYLDYLVVDQAHKGTGLRILVVAKRLLQQAGIHDVHFEIHHDNAEAGRLAQVFGAELDGPYVLGYAHIGD